MADHGHANPRAGGARARCGGPGLCALCALQLAEQHDLLELLHEIFDVVGAARYMRDPQPSLGMQSPVEVIREGDARRVREVLRVLAGEGYR